MVQIFEYVQSGRQFQAVGGPRDGWVFADSAKPSYL